MVLDKFDLEGKIAVITGGGGLLGRKHAEAIIEARGTAIIVDIDNEKIIKAAAELSVPHKGKVFPFSVDITKKDSILSLHNIIMQNFGRVDILINNAAFNPKMGAVSVLNNRFETFPEASWDTELAVGLKGAFFCSQVFGSEMATRGGGVILNICSDLGIIAPDQRLYRIDGLPEKSQPVKPVTYSVLKHGIVGLTKYLATYWADKGIRVNALCPGGVYDNQPDVFVDKLAHLIPMGRMAEINEYKAAVLFLVSDASSYMTGANLIIDGGRTCW